MEIDTKKFSLEEHYLGKLRRQRGIQLWKLKKILEIEYAYFISESSLSRLLLRIDEPMEPRLEAALNEILNSTEAAEGN